MKKRICCFALLALCLILPGIRAFAAELPGKAAQVDRKTSIYLNGKKLKADIVKTKDELYVPLIDACDWFDCDLERNDENGVINIITRMPNVEGIKSLDGKLLSGKKTVDVVPLPNTYFTLNGFFAQLETVSVGDQIFVPLSYFTELMDKKFTWQTKKNKVEIGDFKEEIIGTVNGKEVTKRKFGFYFRKAVFERYGTEGLKNPKATKTALQELKKEINRTLVENMLIEEKLNQLVLRPRALDIQYMNDALMAEINLLSGSGSIKTFIAPENITMGMLINETTRNYVRALYRKKMTLETAASEDQIKAEYDGHTSNYETQYRVRVKHILISSANMPGTLQQDKKDAAKAKAEDILRKLREGGDFDKLMKEFSDDPGQKNNPNGYTFGKGFMVKPFEDKAFSMRVGDISEPVETEYGYHIIKLEEIFPVRTMTYVEAKPLIQEKLDGELKKVAWEKILTEWISKAKVEKLSLN